MRDHLRTGTGAVLVVLIMGLGSFGLWVGAPVLWLWVGSQVQAATESLGTSVGVAFLGAVVTIVLLAAVLSKLSNIYRANVVARGMDDPGHFVLEAVLVISAGITVTGFLIWFFFLSGADPLGSGFSGR